MLLHWFSLLALMIRTVLAVLEGENVCSRRETYTVTLPVWVKEPVQVKTYTWCLGVPPRCTKYRTEMRDKLKIQTAVRERVVMVCCRGYAPDRNETHCMPVCKEGGCLHGLCVSPDTCRCAAGYTGVRCDTECGNSRWGVDCIQPCLCKNGAQCNHVTGDCKCEPGWRGTTCETPCPRGTYGKACMEECQCLSGNCDHVTGECYHKTPLYDQGRTISAPKQTTTSVPVTSVDDLRLFKNDIFTSKVGEELKPSPTQAQSDKTTVVANLEVRQEENEPHNDVSQTPNEELTGAMDESKKHADETEENGDILKHTSEEHVDEGVEDGDISKHTFEEHVDESVEDPGISKHASEEHVDESVEDAGISKHTSEEHVDETVDDAEISKHTSGEHVDEIVDDAEISKHTTEEHVDETLDQDISRHASEAENESPEDANEEASAGEGLEEEKEGSVDTEDNETENVNRNWVTQEKDSEDPSEEDTNDKSEDSDEEDHEIISGVFNTNNKPESDQGPQELPSPPEVIYVSDGLQGDSGEAGTLGLVFSVSIGGGMALALIIMAAGVIFTVARRRRSGKQNLQGVTDAAPAVVPAAIHYTSDVSTLPLPQLFLSSEYQNSIMNEMPLHTLRDTEPRLPPRYGEATLTTFGHPIQLSQDENRTTRAFLELQYDIPPSAIASKNNSMLPGEEPEHVYDEIPAWRNAGEC